MSNKSVELAEMGNDSTVDVAPTVKAHKGGAAKPKALYAALGLMTLSTVGLSIALGTVMSTPSTPPLSLTDMTAAIPANALQTTRSQFSAGEAHLIGGDPSTYTPLASISSARLKRFDVNQDPDAPHHAAAVTHVYDAAGAKTHEQVVAVLKKGVSTLGEFADKFGQVGPRTIRLNVKVDKTGDEFHIVPLGLSMVARNSAHNSTILPDLFYFSFLKQGTKNDDRVVSFCSTASKGGKGTCFLGKGQQQWDTAVEPWAKAYLDALRAEQKSAGRRLLNIGGDIGGWAGDKAGSWAGGKVGGTIGETVGEDVGAAVGSFAGPVGTAVGAAVGGWAGEKIGSEVGSHYGGELGQEAGSWAGSSIENNWG
mmetsp:Transcript_6452/g.10045  ORF Transcript_6452/g.10045 Transcript_6452/m.10045 type:complete len:367 (-) Transcript_6452:399-1499(-)|eukprot:CAMPEP_0175176678 /NCGR_PEP_ID=MMETSP0087-20121206/33942_1 /TAXON_ID=136419 /ORGANISM="Unknown Unknown, Strain D1" /LENGTH=366 /DNA_ID=CAMNT_0016468527 /DNA_START=32 /DNA_END=1132 /DNA_ORIENTATION=+